MAEKTRISSNPDRGNGMIEQTHQERLTVGQLLKKARESKKISAQDVADFLCLDVQRIAHIEADDFSALASPVYVRGYLKKYAEFVSISSEEVLNIFNQNIGKTDAIFTKTPSYFKKEMANTHLHRMRFILLSVLVLLAIFLGIWWHGEHQSRINLDTEGLTLQSLPDQTSKKKVHMTEKTVESLSVKPEKNQGIVIGSSRSNHTRQHTKTLDLNY